MISSKEQNLDRQLEAYRTFLRCFQIRQADNLLNVLNYKPCSLILREGDIVVVTELDRLGRNNKELTELMNQIQQKGATLEVLNLPSMTGIEDDNLRCLINNLMIELYKYQAESERKRIRERQAQGIAIAKQRGRFKGRKKKYSFEDEGLQHAFDLYQQGLTEKEIERKTGINRTTFRRYRQKYNVVREDRKE